MKKHSIKRRNHGRPPAAQTMIDYLVLFTAVTVVMITFLGGTKSLFGKYFNKTMYDNVNTINDITNRILDNN
ncbi:MAG: hypothetical protein Q8Q08_00875 [Candidatus Omnitrophota bacterium]|nr:hypothetical protein [Candidatus Omnitrophota bacterium]